MTTSLEFEVGPFITLMQVFTNWELSVKILTLRYRQPLKMIVQGAVTIWIREAEPATGTKARPETQIRATSV